ncbi:hypothetical protein AGLY_015566 [Aphis glycines]|uniref:Uncharacterized protein n=1 Tax=Aphis glycines TaxID=307491 RepID=A0A6G0T015_APHGL|nr:hypothetical protein AGLY_015566 [Aphis glycines]
MCCLQEFKTGKIYLRYLRVNCNVVQDKLCIYDVLTVQHPVHLNGEDRCCESADFFFGAVDLPRQQQQIRLTNLGTAHQPQQQQQQRRHRLFNLPQNVSAAVTVGGAMPSAPTEWSDDDIAAASFFLLAAVRRLPPQTAQLCAASAAPRRSVVAQAGRDLLREEPVARRRPFSVTTPAATAACRRSNGVPQPL